RRFSSAFALAAVTWARVVHAQCPDPNSFCSGSTCTVGTAVTVEDGCVLAWGSGKTVTIATNGAISVADGGSFTLQAPTVNGDGPLSAPAGTIQIPTTGQFQNRNSGRVQANGVVDDTAGTIIITGNPVSLLNTSRVSADGVGGNIDICGGTRNLAGDCNL